ncbi:uncharacterized protein LOC119641379 [Glossina fuscipes]|uniref:Uncharacterized protein LOC119641379 n=1 Tax=Glossina fuscipes TaxID=7396 RepID=A0A9C6DXV0_9MUSC|nr:uncharacterized protein LOC119641379 [Glossina fuscipes]KAI9577608.1 hypothetical protein GQX74_013302 [Glossina fuscipes]
MSVENTVKLLWDCAAALEPKTHAHKLLKSDYINNCRTIANTKLQMPKEKFGTSQMCSHCGCFWHESEFKLKPHSQQVPVRAKALKLIAKLEETNQEHYKNVLTGKQRRRAKWLKKRITNYMKVKCELCQHKTLIKMEKPQKKKRLNKNANLPIEEEETVSDVHLKSIKKKKNKANKNAGLNKPKQHFDQEKHLPVKTPTVLIPSKPSVEATKQINKTKFVSKQPTVKSKSNNARITQSQSPATKVNSSKKHKSKQSSKISTPPVAVQSKTQRKNSLLQLAALLKQQTTSNRTETAKSTQQRLEALLK